MGVLGREASVSCVADGVRHAEQVLGSRMGCSNGVGGSFFRRISRRRMPLGGGHHVEEESMVV